MWGKNGSMLLHVATGNGKNIIVFAQDILLMTVLSTLTTNGADSN